MESQANTPDRLEDSEIFHILGNDRRRAIVQFLAEENDHIEVSDVATAIADSESESDSVPNNLYKSVYVSLQQTHLPQLEEDGVVEYDSDGKLIHRGSNFQDVLMYVDADGVGQDRFVALHVVLSLLGLAGVTLAGSLQFVSSGGLVVFTVGVLILIGASGVFGLFR